MLAAALTVIAIVTQDQSALRAAPRESAAQQAVLWQGDSLEIRGERGDFLQVYDHRRERAGYIRASQVRAQSLKPEATADLLAVVRFLKDTPGSESLGISYAAAFLRAAPAEAIDGEVFDALGGMAERLARRASASRQGKAGETVAAHLEVVAHYGITMNAFERDGQVQLCYNGDAQRRVMALPSSDIHMARAALALTRHECVSPSLSPIERFALDNWRIEVLERLNTAKLPEVLKNRINLRKAGIWASLAWQRARRAELGEAAAREAAGRAIDSLALINKSELTETDSAAYSDAAIRVGASRWAGTPDTFPATTKQAPKLSIALSAGQPGETCVHLVGEKRDARNPLFTRCTYGTVWSASASANAQGTALALAVQPLDTWREMWVFHHGAGGWQLDVAPPANDKPELGYIEFAGWVPGTSEMLAARENQIAGRHQRSFEVLSMTTLETRKKADRVGSLSVFYRWQDPLWKGGTVALR